MFDVQWMESIGTTLLPADFSWLPGQRPAMLLELIIWFIAVAGVGMLLSRLRDLSFQARPRGRAYAARRVPREGRRWCPMSRFLIPEQGGD